MDLDSLPFIQAKHYHPGRLPPGVVDLLLVHDMEAARSMKTAENVARWFAGPDAPEASANKCIDSKSVWVCVRDEDTAWHAPGVNSCSMGYEFAGYARDTSGVWLADVVELELGAVVMGLDAAKHSVPLVYLDAAALAPFAQYDPASRDYFIRGARGITTHMDVTIATRLAGGHMDPGKNFPMTEFIELVQAFAPKT